MSQPPKPQANAGTVALIAAGIIERRVRFRELDQQDFSALTVYGTDGLSYMKRTMLAVCAEAWMLVEAAEETRPPAR